MTPRHSQFSLRSGFTLLELAIVITIVSLVVAMGMNAGLGAIEAARKSQTQSKMDQIELALQAFRTNNGRLPCPGNLTLLATNLNYGLEASNPGTCTGGAIAANTGPISNIVEGALPYRALGLPEDYMYDGWGRKFAYAVNMRATNTLAMQNMMMYDQCSITVRDAAANAYTSGAVYTLVSYGPTGHGGYLHNGTQKNAGSTNANEQTNCHCNATLGALAYTATYYLKEATVNPASAADVFDDLVRFKERWQMQSHDDAYNQGGGVCQDGQRFKGLVSGSMLYSNMNSVTGDVNADGVTDLILATPYDFPIGKVYVIFGSKSGFPNPLPLGSLNGTNGYMMQTPVAGNAGISLAVGDMNNDGVNDVMMGDSTNNVVYVVFGKTSVWSTPVTLDAAFLNGTNGFRLNGAASTRFGASIAAGDVNGNGIPDLVIGAPQANTYTGITYVVFGRNGGWTSPIAATAGEYINGNRGVELDGPTGGFYVSGTHVAVGDVNANGIADILVGSPLNPTYGGGATFVVFGRQGHWTSPVQLNSTFLNGVYGIRIYGVANASAGTAQAIGDINGDGVGDVIIGGYAANSSTGAVYVVYGRSGSWGVSELKLDNTTMNGTLGFELTGAAAGDAVGVTLAADDINGDGISDVVAGASTAAPGGRTSAGSVFVHFGSKAAQAATSVLTGSQVDGINGFRVDGELAGDRLGMALSAGDINNDGISDLFLSAGQATADGVVRAGITYLYYGRIRHWQPTYDLSTMP